MGGFLSAVRELPTRPASSPCPFGRQEGWPWRLARWANGAVAHGGCAWLPLPPVPPFRSLPHLATGPVAISGKLCAAGNCAQRVMVLGAPWGWVGQPVARQRRSVLQAADNEAEEGALDPNVPTMVQKLALSSHPQALSRADLGPA